MKTVGEVSRLSGVSVRTLRHYDALGLLRPSAVTEAGYRLYDDDALKRLQAILLLRELDFPLGEIGRILDSPKYDPAEALRDQIKLLKLRKERLERLICLAENMLKGENEMDLTAFDREKIESYAEEARRRWGGTAEYKEYESRGVGEDKAAGLMECFRAFGAIKHCDPAGEAAQSAVGDLMRYITENYYTCSEEALSGLAEMYVGDERFRANIDAAGGDGTAEFVRAAVRCRKKTK